MDINNQLKSSNPVLVRLKSEHALLSTEINQLNRELLALKDIIRHKQKDLRKINIALIHKATRGPFLSIVQSAPIDLPSTQAISHTETTFVCIQGGKQSK